MVKNRKYYKKLNIKKRRYFVKNFVIEAIIKNKILKILFEQDVKVKSLRVNYNKKIFLTVKFTNNFIYTCKVIK